MELRVRLADWDGKTIAALKEIAAGPVDPVQLAALCGDPDETVARAASWVLKAKIEKGDAMVFPADLLARDLHWEVALHLLQCVQYLPLDIPPSLPARYLEHERPMLRAWGLDAYMHVGGQAGALVQALFDPAASVRARARKLQ